MKMMGAGLTGWFLGGKIHSRRAVRKFKKQSQEELKTLYNQYIKDVSALQTEILELHSFIKETTRQHLRDEFLMADEDGNQLVSRAEFEAYKKKHLRNHPENAHLFPAFEEFDPDRNGFVSLSEHEDYYRRHDMI